MKSSRRVLCLAVMVSTLACSLCLSTATYALTGDKTAKGTEEIRQIYDALRKVDLDGSRAFRVENFVIQKDISKITLTSGKIWVAKPWKEGEKPTAGWFTGEGRIEMTPPTKIEKDSFKKRLDKDVLDEKFTQAFLRFTDDLYDRMKDKLEPDSAGGEDAVRLFRDRQNLLEELDFNVEFLIISDYLTEGPRQPGFLFEFEMPRKGWISFFYSPARTEQSLYFTHKKVGLGEARSGTIITTFFDKADYESGRDLGHDDKDTFWIRNYAGEIKIDKDGLLLKPRLDMDIESSVDGLKTATMEFLSYFGDEKHAFTLEVVSDAEGTPLGYMHRNNQLLVVLPKALKKGEKVKVHVEYTADYIRPDASIGGILDDPDFPQDAKQQLKAKLSAISQDYATFTLLNTYPWFPQSGFLKRHTFDWTIKVPAPFQAVASGTTVKRWKEEGYECLHTVEKVPIALASVLFGRYVIKTDDKAKPTINVCTLQKQQKQADDILASARNIVTTYEKWFGPFPFEELDVVQMGFLYGFGQAPPGLVQLSGEAFLAAAEREDILQIIGTGAGYSKFFLGPALIAHEIGHEWWGHAVSWANSNDQWLSESYTEYCSGLYVQAVNGEKQFDAKLREWRSRASMSKDSGPIWLGQRLGGRHYQNQTYEKGPYVLHMLRLALQAQAVAAGGPAADGDKMFFDCLRNFIDKFRNQNATTTDFQKVIKATTKVDMDWFFDEWFRGNHWLNVEFKYEVRQTEDKKFLLKATFRQPDKENIKQMSVPMYIHFGKDKVVTRMVLLNKEEYVYQVKLPEAPDKVTLNDYNDILADIKYN